MGANIRGAKAGSASCSVDVTHFKSIGWETGNETRISRISTNFIGFFEDFGGSVGNEAGFARATLPTNSIFGVSINGLSVQ
jgi:hypothetical protein